MQNNQNRIISTENASISQLWFKYFPYWPLFLLFLFLAVAGAWLYIRYETVPLYESTATLLINDEKKGQDDSKMQETLNQLSTKKIVENEMEVLKSRELMDDVVKKYHLYAPIFELEQIKDISAYTSSPVIIETINPDSLAETDKVFFNYDSAKRNIVIQNISYPLNSFVSTPWGMLKFISQNISHLPANPLYFTLVNTKRVALSLVNRLDVTPASKLSSVIDLRIRDEVPKRSEDILNGLIAAYNNASIKQKNTLAANTLAFLDERLNSVGHDLDVIGQKIQHYKSNRSAIDISSQATSFLQNVSTNDQKMSDVNLQLSVLDQIENYVKSKENKGNLVPSTVGITDPQLPQLLSKLYDLQLQYERLKKTTGENNPIMVSIDDQIEKIKPGILDNINNQKLSLRASINSLNSTNDQYSSVLQTIPQKERDLVDISREQNIKSNIYNFLLQKREETSLSLLSSNADSRIVNSAQSSLTPVSPKVKMIYLITIFLAFALTFVTITASELFGRTILFRHEIESYTSIPVIGEIAFEKSKTPLVIGNGKRTFIAEQFRNLRTSLPYIGLNGERKRLQVTSTISGEGKSFIVVNMGMGLALAGKKVVVIEFDLNFPTLCEKLNVSVINKGLTDYLTGNAEPKEIIQRTAIHENLYIVPAGWLPDNPSELIMSEKVPELLNYLSGTFDYIILDTAPVGLLSDAYILSTYCDATLYVVRHKHTRRISLQRLDENNKIHALKNIAIVFNGVQSRGFGKNGYGYGYGYGYSHKEKTRKRGILRRTGTA